MPTLDQLSNGILPWTNGEAPYAAVHAIITGTGILGHLVVLGSLLGATMQANMILTLSLALADLLFVACCFIVNVMNLSGNGYVGGRFTCLWQSKFMLLAGFASVFTLLTATFERYLHIIHQKELNKKQIGLIVAGIWILAAILALFPVFFDSQGSTYGLNSGLTHCTLAWWATEGKGSTFALVTCTGVLLTYLLCSGLMMFCYYQIVMTYMKASRSVNNHSPGNMTSTMSSAWGTSVGATKSQTAEMVSSAQSDKKKKGSQQERVLLTKAIVLTCSFFCLWTPYLIKVIDTH
jgi:hypothetical protein